MQNPYSSDGARRESRAESRDFGRPISDFWYADNFGFSRGESRIMADQNHKKMFCASLPHGCPIGDQLFRAERVKWYHAFTGGSIEGLKVSEQNAICDTIARRFRTYTDGRPPRDAY